MTPDEHMAAIHEGRKPESTVGFGGFAVTVRDGKTIAIRLGGQLFISADESARLVAKAEYEAKNPGWCH